MKNLKTIALALITACLLPLSFAAQTSPDRFVSGEARFSIDLPARSTERKRSVFTLSNLHFNGETISWSGDQNDYANISTYRVTSDNDFFLKPTEKVAAVNEFKKIFFDEYKKRGAMLQEARFTHGGISGIEIRGVSTGRVVMRLFFNKERFFFITVAKRSSDFTSLLNLLNSFRVLDKLEYAAALLAENEPASLPQGPRPQRPLNDAVSKGLKGKVKKVIEESQYSVKEPRERWHDADYDKDGYLTDEVSYVLGFPTDVENWGWIDGMRVQTSESIDYYSGEGPNEKQTTFLRSISETGSDPAKRDERYKTRFEYVYDSQNRITGEKTYGNSGKLFSTTEYSYQGNVRTNKQFDMNGKIWSWYVETFDAAGNITEEQRLTPSGTVDSVTVYKYEFDKNGNWVVQRSFERKKVRGKSVLVPNGADYRTITYYE